MSRIDTLIGKEAIHAQLGKVQVLSRADKGYTRVNIRCVQRGKGWNEATETYDWIKQSKPNRDENGNLTIGNSFSKIKTRRDEYGHEDVCHINELKLIENGI